jgi:acyl carrier protein
MNIESKVKEILCDSFNFTGGPDDLIYHEIDSVRYFKYLLTIEKTFDLDLESRDISTINKTIKAINEAYSL